MLQFPIHFLKFLQLKTKKHHQNHHKRSVISFWLHFTTTTKAKNGLSQQTDQIWDKSTSVGASLPLVSYFTVLLCKAVRLHLSKHICSISEGLRVRGGLKLTLMKGGVAVGLVGPDVFSALNLDLDVGSSGSGSVRIHIWSGHFVFHSQSHQREL